MNVECGKSEKKSLRHRLLLDTDCYRDAEERENCLIKCRELQRDLGDLHSLSLQKLR
jgi:hypothetical protein